jgi:hypothetical protein
MPALNPYRTMVAPTQPFDHSRLDAEARAEVD